LMLVIIQILVFVLISGLILLLVPFRIKLRGRYGGGYEGYLAVLWFWGFFGLQCGKEKVEILLGGKTIFRKTRKGKRKKSSSGKVQALKKAKAAEWIISHVCFLIVMLRKLYSSLSPKGSVKGTIGLGDPAETGIFMGVIAGCMAWLPSPLITIVPDFNEEKFSIEGSLNIRILLISILFITAEFFLSREGRELFHNL